MEIKAGLKTTEFWITALLVIGVLAGWLEGKLPAEWAVVAATVSAAAYGAWRTLAKRGASNDAIVRDKVVRALGSALAASAMQRLPTDQGDRAERKEPDGPDA
jgi:hypothetical protein